MSEISLEELQLATRNHGLPLEALRYDVTPVGLHYLLIHYDIPDVDPANWTLAVEGRVATPMRLALEDLRARPSVELTATMECAGNGRARFAPRPASQPWLVEAVGTARWRGTPLAALLEEASPQAGAAEVVFTGLDRGVEKEVEQRFQRSLPLDEALAADALLAYDMNDAPLPPQHGFPLRLVVPGWYGMTNVKWLASIEVVDLPFAGYQQSFAYRFRADEDDEGHPLTRMLPRALMVPPGIPEFFTRDRTVPLGEVRLEGRAWSGLAPVAGVEVSDDDGETWTETDLGDELAGRWAWRRWTHVWRPRAAGSYTLCSRASDAAGNVQPVDAPWNVGGYSNNSVQRIVVTVTE
jgi:DMSO/TMAO reductase YedYZ molybdopterin-dependent catalytic subunit